METLYTVKQKQDQELTVTQIMNSLLPNSDWNWIEIEGRNSERKFESVSRTPEWWTLYATLRNSGFHIWQWSYQFSSVAQSCLTICDPMDCSKRDFPVHHQFPELAQTHVHQVDNAVQPSQILLSPSPVAFNLSQNWGLLQWVTSSHQVAIVLEFQLQHRSFPWIFRINFL